MNFKPFIKFISESKVDAKEALKTLFQEDFGEKDVELIVNSLAKRLTPELQSTLIITLVNYRNREIIETENKLDNLKQDRDKLLSAIIIANNQTKI